MPTFYIVCSTYVLENINILKFYSLYTILLGAYKEVKTIQQGVIMYLKFVETLVQDVGYSKLGRHARHSSLCKQKALVTAVGGISILNI